MPGTTKHTYQSSKRTAEMWFRKGCGRIYPLKSVCHDIYKSNLLIKYLFHVANSTLGELSNMVPMHLFTHCLALKQFTLKAERFGYDATEQERYKTNLSLFIGKPHNKRAWILTETPLLRSSETISIATRFSHSFRPPPQCLFSGTTSVSTVLAD